MDEARKRANRKGAATETEEEDPIAGLVTFDQPGVELEQILRHTLTETQLGEVLTPVGERILASLPRVGAHAVVVGCHLIRSVLDDQVEQPLDVARHLPGVRVARAVATDDESFWHPAGALDTSYAASAQANRCARVARKSRHAVALHVMRP